MLAFNRLIKVFTKSLLKSEDSGRPISSTVHAHRHDKTQIEIDLQFILDDLLPLGPKQPLVSEIFFYIPKSLGELSKVCDRDQFYRGVTNYFRFSTPELNHGELLARLLKSIEASRQNDLEPVMQECFHNDACIFANSIYRQIKFVRERLIDPDLPRDQYADCILRLKVLKKDIQRFRQSVVLDVKKPSLWFPKNLRKVVLHADEYISNRIQHSFSTGYKQLHEADEGGDRSYFELMDLLSSFLIEEQYYRESMKEYFFIATTTQRSREYFSYRDSLLKKFVSQPLYIETNRKPQGNLYRNIVAAIGAALAACWTMLMDLRVYKDTRGQDIGFEFVMVVFLGVLIYVFKDRIKDLSKEYFNEKLKKFLPDFKSKLVHRGFRASSQGYIGEYEECLRYLAENRAPEDIQLVRKLHGRRDLSARYMESVIHYEKKITLDPAFILQARHQLRSIKEVFRFNVSDLLKNLADPLKNLTVFDSEDGPVDVGLPRTYHINMILRMTVGSEAYISHYRAVINKAGIMRLEPVVEFGDIHYHLDHSSLNSSLGGI